MTESKVRTIKWKELKNQGFVADGGESSIFKAVLNKTELVAVKTIREAYGEKKSHLAEDLKNEVKILHRLSHPGIIHFHGEGESPNSKIPYIVVDWLDGGTLSDRMKEPKTSRLSYLEVLKVAKELASAIEYLHDGLDECVIHRDIKPDNIGFRDGHIKVFDFGLSTIIPKPENREQDPRCVDSDLSICLPRYKMTGRAGSTRYMAPEVIQNKPYNQTVDVYAFSIVLWSLLYWKKPYNNMNKQVHKSYVCSKGNRPPIRKPKPPQLMIELLENGWDSDIAKRPTFKAIGESLDNLIEHSSQHKPSLKPTCVIS